MSAPSFDEVARKAAYELLKKAGPAASLERPKDAALHRLPGGQWHAHGMCFFTTLLNQAEIYSARKLKVVIGSLGFGTHAPVYEYGDPAWTQASQFVQADGRSTDVHVWMEDASGGIYDMLYPEYLALAWFHQRTTDVITRPEAVEGVTRATLAMRGFHYVAAPLQAQRDLWEHLRYVHAAPIAQLKLVLPTHLD